MDGGGTTPFWRALLAVRSEAAWGNFSWLSLRALLESVNDSVAKGIDRSIVNRRRMRWVAAQRERGIDPWKRVRIPGATKLLALGDPGEMDASQYVLVRELRATEADVLLLMSDIVYPAGHIDAWSDAVYLPYFGLPKAAWDEAVAAAGLDEVSNPELAQPDWRVFASPGNHDWYDGLTGFMYHACGAEPLPLVPYSTSGRGLRATIARRLWQSPPGWDRERAHPLRAEAAARAGTDRAPGPMPFQPGPYFSLEIGGAESDDHGQLRVICLDTGIDGSIDVEQAEWLAGEVATEGVPKVLVTGKPLIVDGKIDDFSVDGGNKPRRPGQPRHDTVREILAKGNGVVAWLAGDIHNAQRVEIEDAEELIVEDQDGHCRVRRIEVDRDRQDQLPPLALISGGGGAFLSATHHVAFTADGGLKLEAENPLTAPCPLERSVPADGHWRFPSRGQSVMLFAGRVGRTLGVWLLAIATALLALAVLFASLAEHAPPDVTVGGTSLSTPHVVGGAIGMLVLLVAGTFVAMQSWRWWWKLLAAAPLAVAAAEIWTIDLREGALLGGATLLAVLTPLALMVITQMKAFPTLARWIPKKRIAALGASAAYAFVNDFQGLDVWVMVACAAVAALLTAGAGLLFSTAIDRSELAAAAGKPALGRWLFGVSAVLVVGAAVGAYLLVGWLLDDSVATAARMIVVGDGVLVALGLVGVAVAAASKAHRAAPAWLSAAVVVGLAVGVAGGAAIAASTDWEWWLTLPLVLLGGVVAAIAVVAVTLAAGGGGSPGPAEIDDALRRRDAPSSGPGPRGPAIFHAMTAAAFPGIAQIAESTRPPFHKSYLTIELTDSDTIEFATHGVDEEHGEPSQPIDVVRIVLSPSTAALSSAESQAAGALSKASVD